MKEFTIEEKAKAYDKALEKARQLCIYPTTKPFISDLQDLFPELKESEDERIRKSIIAIVNAHGQGMYKDEMLAWLEKQGEQKSIDNLTQQEAMDIAVAKCFNEQKTADKIEPKFKVGDTMRTLQEANDGYTDGMPIVVSIDNEYYHCTNELIAIKDQDDYEFPPINVKQNHTDKIEPKFRQGDWVVTDKNNVVQIKEIEDNRYVLENTMKFSVCYVDKCWRKWTLQDAKEGDILCTYECCEPKIVFILKGIPKKHYALSYHCYYNIMYPHFNFGSKKGCLAPNDEDVKPATKEQRDTLEKAMADAGYSFDFKKKRIEED